MPFFLLVSIYRQLSNDNDIIALIYWRGAKKDEQHTRGWRKNCLQVITEIVSYQNKLCALSQLVTCLKERIRMPNALMLAVYLGASVNQ